MKKADWGAIRAITGIASLVVSVILFLLGVLVDWNSIRPAIPWRYVLLIAGILFLLITLGVIWGIFKRWMRTNWRYVVPFLLLLAVEIPLCLVYSDWKLVVFSIAHIFLVGIAAWFLLFPRPTNAICTDFRVGLGAWQGKDGWEPQIFPDRGVQLPHHIDGDKALSKMLWRSEPQFMNGEIECEVYLESGAIFNVRFREELVTHEFYMARLDARNWQFDAILAGKDAGWDFLRSQDKLKHRSPGGRLLKMHIRVDGRRIELRNGGTLVDWVDDAEIRAGRISLFAEQKTAFVKKIRITPRP